MQPNWAAPMSNPAQPGPVPQQPSPTQIGQMEHPEDASRHAQAKILTQIGIEKAAQARRAKSPPLQRQSHVHTQDPVTVVSLHELCTEHDTAHAVLSSFINGPADESLLPSHAHSSTQYSDATVLPSSISKFSPKSHRSLADPRLRKASGTPRFSIPDAVKEITVHKRWHNRTNRFIQRMLICSWQAYGTALQEQFRNGGRNSNSQSHGIPQ